MKNFGPRRIFFIIILVLAIGGTYGTIHFYRKYKSLTVDANAKAQAETKRLVDTLGQLMELPKGEVPTVATISDISKLKGQVFFASAKNGDILFAYTAAMKAILYRPSTNKIINVAPITINPDKNQATAEPIQSKTTNTTTKSTNTSTTKR